MHKAISLFTMLFLVVTVNAQPPAKKDEKKEEKKTFKEKLEEIPDMLVAQPDAGPDSNANRIVNFNLYITVNPLWKEKGALIFNDFKLTKTDQDPLVSTMPLPDKKVIQTVNIGIASMKKQPLEKKDAVLAQIKTHLTAFYKEAGLSPSATEFTETMNNMVIGTEKFTTNQGKTGDLYLLHDIQTQQTNLIVLLLIPGDKPNTVDFVQFSFGRFIYETTYPEDVMEWRCFVYPDEQEVYVDFAKKILKTFVVKQM